MHGWTIVIMLTVLAVAVSPLTIGYYQWLARSVLPSVARLPARVARTAIAMFIALPWIIVAIGTWALWNH